VAFVRNLGRCERCGSPVSRAIRILKVRIPDQTRWRNGKALFISVNNRSIKVREGEEKRRYCRLCTQKTDRGYKAVGITPENLITLGQEMLSLLRERLKKAGYDECPIFCVSELLPGIPLDFDSFFGILCEKLLEHPFFRNNEIRLQLCK